MCYALNPTQTVKKILKYSEKMEILTSTITVQQGQTPSADDGHVL